MFSFTIFHGLPLIPSLIVIVIQRFIYGSAPPGATLLGDDEELEEALALAS